MTKQTVEQSPQAVHSQEEYSVNASEHCARHAKNRDQWPRSFGTVYTTRCKGPSRQWENTEQALGAEHDTTLPTSVGRRVRGEGLMGERQKFPERCVG